MDTTYRVLYGKVPTKLNTGMFLRLEVFQRLKGSEGILQNR